MVHGPFALRIRQGSRNESPVEGFDGVPRREPVRDGETAALAPGLRDAVAEHPGAGLPLADAVTLRRTGSSRCGHDHRYPLVFRAGAE